MPQIRSLADMMNNRTVGLCDKIAELFEAYWDWMEAIRIVNLIIDGSLPIKHPIQSFEKKERICKAFDIFEVKHTAHNAHVYTLQMVYKMENWQWAAIQERKKKTNSSSKKRVEWTSYVVRTFF